MEIIELLAPFYEVAWLPWAVQYFFLIGIAATTAMMASGCAFASPGSQGARLLPVAVAVLVGDGAGCTRLAAGRLAPARPFLAFLCTFHALVMDVTGGVSASGVHHAGAGLLRGMVV